MTHSFHLAVVYRSEICAFMCELKDPQFDGQCVLIKTAQNCRLIYKALNNNGPKLAFCGDDIYILKCIGRMLK